MSEELAALAKTKTWALVDLPYEKSVVGCKWVFKIKTKSDGSIERTKPVWLRKASHRCASLGHMMNMFEANCMSSA